VRSKVGVSSFTGVEGLRCVNIRQVEERQDQEPILPENGTE
jgi:hypothetical protein